MKARLVGIFLTYLLVAGPVQGQGAGSGTLSGRILDQQGEGLPGVVLELTGPAGGRTGLSTGTSVDGSFSFQGVPPGTDYALKASIPGFATTVAEKIEVQEGRTTIVSLTLTPSSETQETIRVEARGEIVDTSTTSTATTYNAEFLEQLPLVGRRFNDVLTLAPGVSDTDGDGNVNIRGARDTGLQVRLDGTNISDPFTGHSGRRINLESVQEVELITGGAPAEYGQASGGFVNVTTKSGNNDFGGSFKLFYRSDFLDGDGASPVRGSVPRFSDTDAVLTVGGPIVPDRLWYFATVERLDEGKPVSFADNTFGVETRKGVNAFGKLTWQVDTENRLALQLISGPLRTGGNNIGSRVAPESDFFVRTGGPVAQIGWTAIISPALLLQSLVSHDIGGLDVEPVSRDFRVIQVDRQVDGNGVFTAILPCVIRNCINEPGLSRFFHAPGRTTATGRPGPLQEARPYNFSSVQDVERTTARSDLSYSIEGKGGQHAIKSGFEFNVETYLEDSTNNPVLTDNTCEAFDCPFNFSGTPLPGSRDGLMNLLVFDPVVQQLKADGFRIGAYAQDSWKPLPNLTINLGLRWDREEIDSEGFRDFDPRPETVEALRRYNLVCNAVGSSCTGS